MQLKLTPEVRSQVAELIRSGNTVEVAAAAAGISRATFFGWMARGESDRKADAPYREFRAAVEQARAEAEAVLVTRIASAAAKGSWQAATWLLERRYGERWAKQSERERGGDQAEAPKDPFAEADELSARRRQRA